MIDAIIADLQELQSQGIYDSKEVCILLLQVMRRHTGCPWSGDELAQMYEATIRR